MKIEMPDIVLKVSKPEIELIRRALDYYQHSTYSTVTKEEKLLREEMLAQLEKDCF